MADIQEASLYDRDFYEWALGQARAVAALRDAARLPGSNFPPELHALDWDNLIEELDGLARGVRSELRKRIGTIVEHLAKLELSTVREPRRGWEETVQRSRFELEDLLEQNPSLRRELPDILSSPLTAKAARFATDALIRRGEVPLQTVPPNYGPDDIIENWWPAPKGIEE